VTSPAEAAFWVSLDDWQQLHWALRSTTVLLQYVTRVLDGGIAHPPLGHELERFSALVAADAEPDGRRPASRRPWLTLDAIDYPDAANEYRRLLEDVWPPGHEMPEVPIDGHRQLVEFLDATTPGAQCEVGRWLRRKREALFRTGEWQSGAFLIDRSRLSVYACDFADNHVGPLYSFDGTLGPLAAVRSLELSEQTGDFVPCLRIGHLIDSDGMHCRHIFVRGPMEIPRQGTCLHKSASADSTSCSAVPSRSTSTGSDALEVAASWTLHA
jgi:hypothetical protein